VVHPGEEMLNSKEADVDSWLEKMRSEGTSFSPTSTGPQQDARKDVPLPYDPKACGFFYVRKDGAKCPLNPQYDGPFLVLSNNTKTFLLLVGDKEEFLSVTC